VMVNVAFPWDQRNFTAMEAGLDVLRGMAERGNSHMRARYLLLMDLRSVIGLLPSRQAARGAGGLEHQPQREMDEAVGSFATGQEAVAGGENYASMGVDENFTAGLEAPFHVAPAGDLDLNDMMFWDEVSGNIGLTMDIDMIETARSLNLRNDAGA